MKKIKPRKIHKSLLEPIDKDSLKKWEKSNKDYNFTALCLVVFLFSLYFIYRYLRFKNYI